MAKLAKRNMAAKSGHSPTLNTVLMVERALEGTKESAVSVPDLKRSLPKQVNHCTLKAILGYLEESNKIVVSLRGITWIHNPNANLRRAIARGMEI